MLQEDLVGKISQKSNLDVQKKFFLGNLHYDVLDYCDMLDYCKARITLDGI